MIQTLLVDLDDTLIENDVANFLPAYFDLLATELSVFAPKEHVLAAIMSGTKAMLANGDPEKTLAGVFYDSFHAATGAERSDVAVVLDRFYRESYTRLASFTKPRPQAPGFLKTAAAKRMELAVATNPLMIRSAIEHRLRWGAIPSEAFGYALITDVETFHFAKPRAAYLAEALAYLGRLPSEAVMVGNDMAEDLQPAESLGLPVFHVGGSPSGERAGGDLAGATKWLAELSDGELRPSNEPAALIARFEGQLAAALTMLARLGDDGLQQAATEQGLAPLQVICHLRDVDREINLPRLKTILETDDPFFSPVDTDTWIVERAYLSENPTSAVAGFVAGRKAVTAALRDLSPEQWQRRARHSLLGPVSLAEWIAVLVEHDLRHVAQIEPPSGPKPPVGNSN